jgi:hypothetical protein
MVKQYTSTPRGDIDGPNLNDGTQVKLPPHLTGQIARASRNLVTASTRQSPQVSRSVFAVPWPPQGIFANQEINQIGDLKGLSWRVYNAGTRRIAQIVEAYPVTIQAADLRQALATGLINALSPSLFHHARARADACS